jgi:hypothetical protein
MNSRGPASSSSGSFGTPSKPFPSWLTMNPRRGMSFESLRSNRLYRNFSNTIGGRRPAAALEELTRLH